MFCVVERDLARHLRRYDADQALRAWLDSQANEVAKYLEVSQSRAMSLLVEFERDDFETTFEDIIESKGAAAQRQDYYQRKVEMLLESLELNSRDLNVMRNNRKLLEQALSYQNSMADADHQS